MKALIEKTLANGDEDIYMTTRFGRREYDLLNTLVVFGLLQRLKIKRSSKAKIQRVLHITEKMRGVVGVTEKRCQVHAATSEVGCQANMSKEDEDDMEKLNESFSVEKATNEFLKVEKAKIQSQELELELLSADEVMDMDMDTDEDVVDCFDPAKNLFD